MPLLPKSPALLAAAMLLAGARCAGAAGAPLSVGYDVLLLPGDGRARVTIEIEGEGTPDALRFRIDPRRHVDFTGPGEIEMEKGRLVWRPPGGGGKLRYEVVIDHDRNGPGKDAMMTERFALFRGEDLFPPMATDTHRETETDATATFEIPDDWSLVTPWEEEEDGVFRIEQPHRFFDRPTGWVIAGRLGVTRETVSGIRIAISNPAGHDVRRLDILALLEWNLDELVEVFPEHPERFSIVGADDPMWRGGLSGPDSLYLHADRPLLQRDGTSPILHELMHSFMHAKAGEDGDWIVEGLAEYYSLALLRRSRTISKYRFEKSLKKLAEKGEAAKDLRVSRADAAVSARGAIVLHELDARIRKETDDEKSLDDVVRVLQHERERVTTKRFQEIAEDVSGTDLDSFFEKHLGS